MWLLTMRYERPSVVKTDDKTDNKTDDKTVNKTDDKTND